MDKKNTIIGISLLIIGFVLMFQMNQPDPNAPARVVPLGAPADPASDTPATPSPTAPATIAPTATVPTAGIPTEAVVEDNNAKADEQIALLENEFIAARITNYGAAIKDIVLKKFEATIGSEERYTLNELHYAPALSLIDLPGADKDTVYTQLPKTTSDSVAFRATLPNGLEVTRRYTIKEETEGPAPYTIRHQLAFKNGSAAIQSTGDIRINIGTAAPQGAQDAQMLTFGYYNGEDTEFIARSKFEGGFFSDGPKPYISEAQRIDWASIKNQFFITILTPDQNAVGFLTQPVTFPLKAGSDKPNKGITADVQMGSLSIPAGETQSIGFDFYAGPKEHNRLVKMEQEQETAMQFGFLGPISKGLLLLMNGLHSIVQNYGLAIIALTLVVRGILLPINITSARSMKRMGKLSEPMKQIKERFPDNQQKQQQAMMALYKLNKVNPVASCLPMLMQLPVFFGLFYMLRGASELRFASFLWIQDLSMQDTVAYVADLPLNILPFVWVASMAYQMWTMPQPAMDNAQAKMMKFMPFIFFPFTYTFSSGLVLYWTVSNVFTIGQQWLMNRKKDDFEVILPPELKKAMDGKGKRKKKK